MVAWILRELYYSKGHEVTDVQTMCEQVIEGDPKQCIIICVEITSIKKGDELVGEYSKVSQRNCEANWIDREVARCTEWPNSSTQSPTYYPTDLADDGQDVDIILSSNGNDHIINWTDSGSTSHTDKILMAGESKGSKGSKSDGYLKGSNGEYSKSSKSKDGKQGYDQSNSLKVYYVDNGKGGGG
jgi:hypothetical protein